MKIHHQKTAAATPQSGNCLNLHSSFVVIIIMVPFYTPASLRGATFTNMNHQSLSGGSTPKSLQSAVTNQKNIMLSSVVNLFDWRVIII